MLRAAVPFLLVLACAAPADAHIPPPAYMRIAIGDARTEVTIAVAPDVFPTWFRFETDDGAFDLRQRAAVEDVLAKCLDVRVDGLPVDGALQPGSIESFEDHMRTWRYVTLRVRFETKLAPKQVAFVWRGKAADGVYVFTDLEAELEAYGEMLFPAFTEKEPEFIWHRPIEAPDPPPVTLPPPPDPGTFRLPLLYVLLVLAIVSCRVWWPRRWGGVMLAITLLVLSLAAYLFEHTAVVEVPLPGKGGPSRPPDEDALAIFASLHRGIYAAMEGEDEYAVYDGLEQNVTAELLQRLYLDIRRSMVLQQEGGAVARIQKTEMVETSVLDEREEGAPWFKVKARWRVVGRVGHWGHTHERINEYLADATVVARDGRWKIAAIDVLEETRIDDGEKVK